MSKKEKLTEQRTIAEQIEDSSFFKEGLNWYLSQFTISYSTRALSILLFIACISITSLSIFNIYSMFPLKKPFTLVKMVERGEDEFSIVKVLDKAHKLDVQAEDLVSRHLIEEYVKRYERYTYTDMDDNARFVKNSSSRSVFLSYQRKLDSHPMISEQNEHYRRFVTITDSILEASPPNNNFVRKAIVKFEVQDIENEAVTKRTNYRVDIQFNISNIKMAIGKLVPFGFSVMSYDVTDEEKR